VDNTPALHNYGHMPRPAREIVEPRDVPRNWKPSGPKLSRRIAMSTEPRGGVRRIVGISVAVALTLLIFVTGGTLFPKLLGDDGALLGFLAALFVASVVAGYFVSGLSIRSVTAD